MSYDFMEFGPRDHLSLSDDDFKRKWAERDKKLAKISFQRKPPRKARKPSDEDVTFSAGEIAGWCPGWRIADDPLRVPPSRSDLEAYGRAFQNKPRRSRKPSTTTVIKRMEKAGHQVTSVTLPDGTKLDLGKSESAEPENPWPLDEFRKRKTKQ